MNFVMNARECVEDDFRPLLTIRETARKYKLPERMLRGWKAEGILPCIERGNRAYVKINPLLQMLSMQGNVQNFEGDIGNGEFVCKKE